MAYVLTDRLRLLSLENLCLDLSSFYGYPKLSPRGEVELAGSGQSYVGVYVQRPKK